MAALYRSRQLARRLCFLICISLFSLYYLLPNVSRHWSRPETLRMNWVVSKVPTESLSLTETQCRSRYPTLFTALDAHASRTDPFELKEVFDYATGEVQGKIKDGQLYIISTGHEKAADLLMRRAATLQALYRAVITSPTPIPDTIFTFSVQDYPANNSWSSCMASDPQFYTNGINDTASTPNYWLMPHFSSFAWPSKHIGSRPSALRAITQTERTLPFSHKISQAIWRGTPYYNPIANPSLRPSLLSISQGKQWSNISALIHGATGSSNAIPIEDFCRYKYVIYTEGVTYSGRLDYHRACESILLTQPLEYSTHISHLLKPVYASDLLAPTPSRDTEENGKRHPAWPISFPLASANAIFLSRDWIDLDATITYLEAHPAVAAQIAGNQKRDMVHSGVLSTSADVCYWRVFLRLWGERARMRNGDSRLWDGGVTWEDWALGMEM